MRKADFKNIDDLETWENNYRRGNVDLIVKSIKAFGFNNSLAIKDGKVWAGNHRLLALKKIKSENQEKPIADRWTPFGSAIDEDFNVLVVNVDHLSEEELVAFAIADNRTSDVAENNNESLLSALKSVPERILPSVGYDATQIENLARKVGIYGKDENYSSVIETPIYEPKNKKPDLDELVDLRTVEKLHDKINRSSLPEKEKQFLRVAAYRHAVFNYELIADYYSHSDAETQDNFEESALVIIDFDRAIELGFVDLINSLIDSYSSDYPTNE